MRNRSIKVLSINGFFGLKHHVLKYRNKSLAFISFSWVLNPLKENPLHRPDTSLVTKQNKRSNPRGFQ